MKKKSGAQIYVADGKGGLVPVDDHRFSEMTSTVQREIPAGSADAWFEYLHTESEQRKWSHHGITQHECEENSGSLALHTGVVGQSSEILIVWERTRTGPLKLKVSSAGTPSLSLEELASFVDCVIEQTKQGKKRTFLRRGYLCYEGLPWRGEVWLTDRVRLGPPTRFGDTLIAPQVVLLDANVDAIGWQGAHTKFESLQSEICAFLSLVLRIDVSVLQQNRKVWTIDPEKLHPILSFAGYWELDNPTCLPRRGEHPEMPRRQVQRVDRLAFSITSDTNQQWLPTDTMELWDSYSGLDSKRRDQFLRAAGAHSLALRIGREHRTASLALTVVGCEALKPPGKKHDRWNVYDVVQGLLGMDYAQFLRQLRFPPQRVRNRHFHRGVVLDLDAIRGMPTDTFWDPTSQENFEIATSVMNAAAVEWLRNGGVIKR